MNNISLNKIMLVGVMAFGFASSANAIQGGNGKISFEGTIVTAPCSISPATRDQTVSMGDVSSEALANKGTSLPVPFEISLDNCAVGTGKTVSAKFTGASGGTPDMLGLTGTAKGASLVMTDGAGNAIKLNQSTPVQALQNGTNTMSFSAYLVGDNTTVTPGTFNGVTNFTLDYL